MVMCVELFKKLPNEIIEIVWNMLDNTKKVVLNKDGFYKFHNEVYTSISLYNKYTLNRVVIKNDDSLVFQEIVNKYASFWLQQKKYICDNKLYNNYLYFILALIYQYNASKCNEILNNYLKKEGLSKNLYKKYRIKNIRWSN
tara:strand:+ start:1121 stop:1546 length:426 start_codon:yes stop_codon:yes gene_type:complete